MDVKKYFFINRKETCIINYFTLIMRLIIYKFELVTTAKSIYAIGKT